MEYAVLEVIVIFAGDTGGLGSRKEHRKADNTENVVCLIITDCLRIKASCLMNTPCQ